jgi:hypothetical protein
VTNKPSSLFPSQNAGRKKKGKREKFERKKNYTRSIHVFLKLSMIH